MTVGVVKEVPRDSERRVTVLIETKRNLPDRPLMSLKFPALSACCLCYRIRTVCNAHCTPYSAACDVPSLGCKAAGA
jgi:hypothetical protein